MRERRGHRDLPKNKGGHGIGQPREQPPAGMASLPGLFLFNSLVAIAHSPNQVFQHLNAVNQRLIGRSRRINHGSTMAQLKRRDGCHGEFTFNP